MGLERSWFTHMEVDSSRGEVAHLTQHVSGTESYTVFEIVSDRGMQVFTERDLDRFGNPLGKEAVQKLAQRTVEDLNLIHMNAKLTTRVIPDITLYAITNRGVLHAIDAETGRTLWVTAIGTERHPSEAAGTSDKYVAAVNGSQLSVLEKSTGKVVWQQKVVGAPGAGPVISQRFVYVPMISGQIEGYDLDAPRQLPWVFQSHGRAMTQPIYTGEHIAWTTDLGHLDVIEADVNQVLYRFETSKSVVSRPARLGTDRVVVASIDGYVHCLKEERGTIVWRFSSGEPVMQSPVAIDNRLYVITEDGNLYALAGDTGLQQWQSAGMRQFVAASKSRLYCVNELGNLAVLDPANGTQIGSLMTESLDFFFANFQTDRILIGTKSGKLQSLHETSLPWPVVHVGVLPEVKVKQPPKRKPAEAPKTEKPAVDNPFGAEAPAAKPPAAKPEMGGDDPFAAGASEPPAAADPAEKPAAAEGGEAKPAAAKSSDDPFGFRSTPASMPEKRSASPAPQSRKSTTPKGPAKKARAGKTNGKTKE